MAGWPDHRLQGWLVDWLASYLTGWHCCLADWLAEYSGVPHTSYELTRCTNLEHSIPFDICLVLQLACPEQNAVVKGLRMLRV
jgi:hypothetical protein